VAQPKSERWKNKRKIKESGYAPQQRATLKKVVVGLMHARCHFLKFHNFFDPLNAVTCPTKSYPFRLIDNLDRTRVARRHTFKPNIPIWVSFGGSCNGRCWFILWPFGLFYGHLINYVTIWYILWLLVYFSRFGMLLKEKSGNPGQESHL
jgi:hypothetical protein